MKQAKWIWANTPALANEYVTFYDEFEYSSGKVKVDISVSGDYALYINGELALFEQYPDYPHYKVYDSEEITPFLKQGKNTLKIVCWYIGADWLTSVKMPCGLAFEIYSETQTLSCSKAGLKCWLNKDYESHSTKHITTQLGFSYLYDTRFVDEPSEVSAAIEVEGFENLVVRQNEKARLGDYVKASVFNEKNRIYDLGKECCGFLRFKFKTACGAKVRVTYGEHLIDGKVRDIIDNRDFSVEFVGNGEFVDFTGVFRRLGCRYLQVYGDESLVIEEIGVQEVEYPFNVKPYSIENTLREKIYQTSVRTLQLCAHEHYEDCPWREQGMYIQDSRNQMLCGYYAFENKEFARSAILTMMQGQRESGLFELCFPAKIEFTIPSFSLAFPAVVLEYLQVTKDLEVGKKAFVSIEKTLAFFLKNLEQNGLYKTVSDKTLWHFYEWAGDLDGNFFAEDENKKRRNGYDSLINAFLAWACSKTAEIARILGETNKANEYSKIQEKLNLAINEVFYDEQNGLYKTYAENIEFSQLANALCVLCGACTSERLDGIAKKLAYGYENWVENTLSMNIYRFDALLLADKEKYAEVVLQEIDKTYETMLQEGATSFWETLKGAEDFDGAGSLCHGWSALPIYYYHILGVVKSGS